VNNHDLPPSVPNAHRRTTEIPWKLLFRIVRWSTYAGSVITLVLVLHKSPPPDVHVTAQAAAHVDEKLEQVQQAAASGQPAALHIDETELNSYLATHFALSGNVSRLQNAPGTASPAPDAGTRDSLSPTSRGAENADAAQDSSAPTADDVEQMRSNVKDVKVQLVGDVVKAYVVFDVHGKDMTLQLEGKLGSENGYIRFDPTSGQIGALPLPLSALQGAMQRLMESPENREKLRLPADISDLKIENGEVVTTYK